MRAAIEEANDADEIVLPPTTYVLTQVKELIITRNLTITGRGASITIIDGNKSVRPDRGLFPLPLFEIVAMAIALHFSKTSRSKLHKPGFYPTLRSFDL